jgi:hypothetical protein
MHRARREDRQEGLTLVLAALRANARGDAAKIKSLCKGATYAGFAITDVAGGLPGN